MYSQEIGEITGKTDKAVKQINKSSLFLATLSASLICFISVLLYLNSTKTTSLDGVDFLYAVLTALAALFLYPILGVISVLILEKVAKIAKDEESRFAEKESRIDNAALFPAIFPIGIIYFFVIGVINLFFKD